ncbi:MAG: TerB family tellurite resistance protein [Alphaproteobacteria bacterium]|nr:TerB family tellurite resistance protein [Alphaproteobacteria bacterium]
MRSSIEVVSDYVVTRASVTIALPGKHSEHGPVRDVDTVYDDPAGEWLPLGLLIRYVDAVGEISSRRVTVYSCRFSDKGDPRLTGYCHLRKAKRSFRADRILEAVDAVTGEVYSPPSAFLEHFGFSAVDASPVDQTAAAIRAAQHGLTVLVFLARCDGHVHLSERDVLHQYLIDRAFEYEIDVDRANVLLDRFAPDAASMMASATLLAKGAGETSLERVLLLAARMIDADGVIDEQEAKFAVELKSVLQDITLAC